ncbi:MAG: hypothetical protein HGA36_04240 [Candidatus Moranbacteria bacterium]|nr:hypothetical protein [Candidatus Moranbacteria bacterium]
MTESIIDRHNVRDRTPGESGTIPAETNLEKKLKYQFEQAFKKGTKFLVDHPGISKGSVYETACSEYASRKAKEMMQVIEKSK